MMMLTIDHVPNAIAVRAVLTPAEVDARATMRVETRDPRIVRSIAHAVSATKEVDAPSSGADLRYAIRIRDAYGGRTTIYLDAFGLRGVLDGRPVRFANDAIRRAIVAAYPHLAT